MADLDARIRARLDEFCESDMCAEDGKAALLTVLDLHRPGMPVYGEPTCHHCYEVMDADHETAKWPCPTVRAIAEKLGVEATDARG